MVAQKLKQITFLIAFGFLISCKGSGNPVTITVTNHLNIPRNQEIISIPFDKIRALAGRSAIENILVKEQDKKDYLITQQVDTDSDGDIDEILIRVSIGPKEKKDFILESAGNIKAGKPKSPVSTFSRFVPERAKDYAWENDKVAFRIYGSDALPGSGGGIDAWLKRVNYPIINKWYKNNAEKEGAYHIDSGEGYDPYQVGASRGIGGTGIWKNDSLYVSANFISSKTGSVSV